jgi:hypothetical protein
MSDQIQDRRTCTAALSHHFRVRAVCLLAILQQWPAAAAAAPPLTTSQSIGFHPTLSLPLKAD